MQLLFEIRLQLQIVNYKKIDDEQILVQLQSSQIFKIKNWHSQAVAFWKYNFGFVIFVAYFLQHKNN